MKEPPGHAHVLCPSAVIRFLKFSNLSTNRQHLQHMDYGLLFDCLESESRTPVRNIIYVTGFDLVVEYVNDTAADSELLIRIWCESLIISKSSSSKMLSLNIKNVIPSH
jgi:hypothetical protein